MDGSCAKQAWNQNRQLGWEKKRPACKSVFPRAGSSSPHYVHLALLHLRNQEAKEGGRREGGGKKGLGREGKGGLNAERGAELLRADLLGPEFSENTGRSATPGPEGNPKVPTPQCPTDGRPAGGAQGPQPGL